MVEIHPQTLTFWSQLDVTTAIPFWATDNEVTRFSCPDKVPKNVLNFF